MISTVDPREHHSDVQILPKGTIAPTLNESGSSFDDGARAVLDQVGKDRS
jgi:hypothetical protein